MALVGKDQLVHEVAEGSGLEIAQARRVLDETFRAIETQLGEGNEVRLTGFGKFSVSRRKAREGRNPQTGEPIRIAARKVPHFSAGTELRKAVPQASQEGASGSKSRNRPKTVRSKRKLADEKAGSPSDGQGSQDEVDVSRPDPDESRPNPEPNSISPSEESPDAVEQADLESRGTSLEDEESSQNEGKRATGEKRGPKTSRKPSTARSGAAPEDEAAPGSSGAEEGESLETSAAGKAVSVAASGAKYALVAAAGLAAGVAGGLAIMHKR